MSAQWHPDAEALAEFRAGLVDGLRGRRLAAHVAGCAYCASVADQLEEVTSALAAVPVPALPAAFESQLTAALAAEATARASAAQVTAPELAAPAGPAAAPGPSPSRAHRGARPARTGGLWHGRRLRLAYALGPAVACLLAGFGYLVSQGGASPVASTAASAPSAATSMAPAVANHGAGGAGGPSPARKSFAENSLSAFAVTMSGTNYRQATLRQQVGHELAMRTYGAGVGPTVPSSGASSFGASGPASPTAVPAASAAGAGGSVTTVPSPALVGCVLKLTGGIVPSLVDEATYQGRVVYVIAVPDRAWVVGLGCTASKPDVITTVSLGTAG